MRSRTPVPPRPSEKLAALATQRLLRDYPETLAVLRRHGAELSRVATLPLSEVVDAGNEGTEALVAEVAATIAWRGGEPCGG